MCGIGGILFGDPARKARESELAPLRDALRHRGPDGEGLFVDGPCGLAHTRLAILDLSERALQPMRSPSGRYVLSYNGEIYNFRELRAELERAGCRFATTGDSEVILHLMEQGGAAALESLRGMFAFAIYDRERGSLLLMRDRLGIKPLFWAQTEQGVAFASEPKALRGFAEGGAPPPESVAEYLAFRVVAERECLLPGIRTLQPGERLRTDGRTIQLDRWWEPGAGERANPADADEIVSDAVRRQLVSDVPVGIFLSGGVDSALVSAAAAKALPSLDTFTVGFDEPGWDESDRARVVAETVGARMHRLRLSPDDYLRGLGEAIWFHDSPLNHAHSVHLLALSRFARRHITVALTGEGADELFGGYPRYRLFRLGRAMRWLPGALKREAAHRLHASRPRWARLLEAADADAGRAAARNAEFVELDEAARLAGLAEPERALSHRLELLGASATRGADPLVRLFDFERRTYLVSLLQRMDRMSMAASLETRVPVLDESVLDYASCIDPDEKLDWRETKKPLRRAAERRFGEAYARLPKFGFGVPVGIWMRAGGPLDPLVTRVLGDRRTAERGWIDAERAQELHREHRAGSRDRTEALWGLLNLELWARVCVDGEGPKGVPLA